MIAAYIAGFVITMILTMIAMAKFEGEAFRDFGPQLITAILWPIFMPFILGAWIAGMIAERIK